MQLDVNLMRVLFRGLQLFRAAYEDSGIDILPLPDGSSVCLLDLEYLVEMGLPLLPDQQRRAIELVLIGNMRERDAAVAMGVSETNPVAMYATLGIEKLLVMIEEGYFPRFKPESDMRVVA